MAGLPSFHIEFDDAAKRDLKKLQSEIIRTVLQEIQTRLTTEPYREFKTRIKKLSGFIPPLYRLRTGDYRTYYRIIEKRVVILAVLHKKDSDRWLRRMA